MVSTHRLWVVRVGRNGRELRPWHHIYEGRRGECECERIYRKPKKTETEQNLGVGEKEAADGARTTDSFPRREFERTVPLHSDAERHLPCVGGVSGTWDTWGARQGARYDAANKCRLRCFV